MAHPFGGFLMQRAAIEQLLQAIGRPCGYYVTWRGRSLGYCSTTYDSREEAERRAYWLRAVLGARNVEVHEAR